LGRKALLPLVTLGVLTAALAFGLLFARRPAAVTPAQPPESCIVHVQYRDAHWGPADSWDVWLIKDSRRIRCEVHWWTKAVKHPVGDDPFDPAGKWLGERVVKYAVSPKRFAQLWQVLARNEALSLPDATNLPRGMCILASQYRLDIALWSKGKLVRHTVTVLFASDRARGDKRYGALLQALESFASPAPGRKLYQ